MADPECEFSPCKKRFYTFSGEPEQLTVQGDDVGGTFTVENFFGATSEAAKSLKNAAKEALLKRAKDGKVIKKCPGTGCTCDAERPADPPGNTNWSAEKLRKYHIVIPTFTYTRDDGSKGTKKNLKLNFQAKERHITVDGECNIDDEEIGFVFVLNEQFLVVVRQEIINLADAVNPGLAAAPSAAREAGKSALKPPCSET